MSFHGLAKVVFALIISGSILVGCDQRPAAMDATSAHSDKSVQAKRSLEQIKTPASDFTDSSSALAADCAQDEYQKFFEDFVELVDARKDYVSHEVEVLDAKNPARKLGIITREQYDGFRIGVVDSRWVYTNDPVTVSQDSPLLDVNIKSIDDQTFRVDYVKAKFDSDDNVTKRYGKPGGYIFKYRDHCWYLTQELR
jgi:hypothetical protein